MTIKALYPNIIPSLSLDFANVENLDPRITFARASTATYYNGVTTAKAEENLLIRSQDYSATWTVTNLTPVTGKTAPDATSTATEFTASAANAVLTQGYTAIAGSYTFSVFLRRVTGSGDIQIAADNGTWTTKVITGTWARYDVTQTVAAGSKTAGVRVVTSTDAIEVWGAQLEQRSAVTAYTPTTTQPITNYVPVLLSAANNVARFDHNPVTGESLGLLIEEQRTNLLERSEEFDDAYWTKTNSSITANTIVAPDGALTGDKLVEDTTASATHQVSRNIAVTSGVAYTFSFILKAGERTRCSLELQPGNVWSSSQQRVFIDLAAGIIVATTGGANTAAITNLGNGWYRCSISSTASVTGTATFALLANDPSGNRAYTGDGYSGLYIWGAQLEAGAFPTSYIPTVASQVTRSADAASMTGVNFSSWYNQAEGTLYGETTFITGDVRQLFQVTGAGTAANDIGINSTSAAMSPRLRINVNSVNQAEPNVVLAANTLFKTAGAYKVNNVNIGVNGSLGTLDTDATIPVVDRLFIGARDGGSRNLNTCIRKLSYYPKRLTDSELVALTT